MTTYEVQPAGRLRGSITVPGDKSGSHRALMISALAAGESVIEGLSPGEDVRSTSRILVQLGATRHDEEGRVVIVGPAEGLRFSADPLDCGNSGTTMRLMAGIVSAIPGEHHLIGDHSLSKRPMDRVAQPLSDMGAFVEGHGSNVHAPLTVVGKRPLEGISYHVPIASAQVKSAILLAGLSANRDTSVIEDVRTRSTTEDMLTLAGLNVLSTSEGSGRHVRLQPGRPRPRRWRVPGDPSQAAFFCVLGLIHRDAIIEVASIDATPERIGFVDVLRRMGAKIEFISNTETSSLASSTSSLHGTDIDAAEIPSVDEVPILVVAAAAATGVTAFRDMGELRHKESDRFSGSMTLALALGCEVTSSGDDFFVHGLGGAEGFARFSIDAGLDHRMVMSSAVAGLAGNGCSIEGVATVASSYPSFFTDVDSLR